MCILHVNFFFKRETELINYISCFEYIEKDKNKELPSGFSSICHISELDKSSCGGDGHEFWVGSRGNGSLLPKHLYSRTKKLDDKWKEK